MFCSTEGQVNECVICSRGTQAAGRQVGALGSSRALPLFQSTVFTGSAVLTAVVQYCNFCQLSSWMRSSLATAIGAGPLLLLLYVSLCPDRYVSPAHQAGATYPDAAFIPLTPPLLIEIYNWHRSISFQVHYVMI